MKYKKLVKLGIISGTIVVGALIAISRPEVRSFAKNATDSFLSQFAKEEDTFQTITVTAADIANAGPAERPVANVSENSGGEERKSATDVLEDIKAAVTGKTEETKEETKETAETKEVSPYQDAHEKFETGQMSQVPESAVQCTVKRVVDGDTYLVDIGGKETKLRLIGVDTPESVADDEYLEKSGKENTDFGKDVSNIMKSKLPEGTTLFVVTDVQEMDKYGRMLGYVYFEDGQLIQDYLLSNGYARVMTVQPNVALVDHFVALEQKAMEEGKGIWKDYADSFGYDEPKEIE